MKLYFSPFACSLASHIVMNELGMTFESVPVNLQTHHYKGGDFYAVNPKGYVPALEMSNGEVLTEGSAILQYLADQKPETHLIPKAGTMERYRCQEWLNFIATEIHKGMGPLWKADLPEESRNMIKTMLGKRFDYLTGALKSHDFLMGKQYTVADAYLFTILNWAPMLKIDLTKWPALMGFMERVKTRPAVAKTLQTEGAMANRH